jgi:hypothetical protein
MARITHGFATSFSPQLHVPAEMWQALGERDKNARAIFGPDGKTHTYEEMTALVSDDVRKAVEPAEQAARHKRCTDDIANLAKRIQGANLDALIVFTDDEHRLFEDESFPAVFVYAGETVPFVPNQVPENAPPVTKAGQWAYGTEPLQLPGAPQLAQHVLKSLPKAGFDVTRSNGLKEGRGIGHHIGFVNTRLLEGKRVPLLPILFNASFPPNVLTPARFYGFGQAIAQAVSSWPEDAHVGVLAVGGFSHPGLDEATDRKIMEACKAKDAGTLKSLPEDRLTGGNGQGRVWIAAAGALGALEMTFDDYVAAYRSAGGTGCGMGFAAWE